MRFPPRYMSLQDCKTPEQLIARLETKVRVLTEALRLVSNQPLGEAEIPLELLLDMAVQKVGDGGGI